VSTRLARDELAFWREGPRRTDVVEVSFRDSGPGVPEESAESVFVPFFTTKEKGTGLGLAICQRLVKAHQGTIQLRSRPGEGAEFLVSLPGLREERPSEATRPPLDADEKARARERRRAGAEARLRRRRRRKQQA
jgi:signal transduction histidine kinase